MKPLSRELAVPAGHSADRVLRALRNGPYDPTALVGSRYGTWLAFRTPEGPTTLRVLQRGRSVAVGAWGPGAQAALVGSPALLGLEDDWSDFDEHVLPRLPERLASLRRLHPGLASPASGRMWDALFPAILGQKVTAEEALNAFASLTRRFGDPAPGAENGTAPPWLRLPLAPEQVRRISSWDWHAARVDRSRATTAMEAARASGLGTLGEADERTAYARLQHLPGVGPWTAAETVQRTHAAKDAVSVGDYHVAHLVGQALIGRRVDDDGMLHLLRPFDGQRQRVVRVIFSRPIRKQAYGPRLAPEDHRGR